MRPTFIIEGRRITDIPSLYVELNRVFMAGEDWTLGASLDALDDMLYGGYGALQGHDTATLVWRDMAATRAALGVAATVAWLQQKRDQPGTFNATQISSQLDALQRGEGQTYFDIVLEIIAGHPAIELQAPP